jgi:hypothetical protein
MSRFCVTQKKKKKELDFTPQQGSARVIPFTMRRSCTELYLYNTGRWTQQLRNAVVRGDIFCKDRLHLKSCELKLLLAL